MRKKLPKILVTGAAGFIGSAFVRQLVEKGYRVAVIDNLTYAADLKRLACVKNEIKFFKADIADTKAVESILKKFNPEIVINFAAETHVDRSIRDVRAFLRTNIIGTQVLLDISKKLRVKKFIQVSTDEVYGEIKKGSFSEKSPLRPNSPYAASKAAADLLIKSYIRTYDFPAIIVRPCNNYGIWQYPEKLIPLAILKIFRHELIPIYARGKNVREWLYVEDCAKGIFKIMQKGKIGEVYNLGSSQERQNLEVINLLLKTLKADKNSIKFVKDRPGHDLRYKLNRSKMRKEIGWFPEIKLKEGLRLTVKWAKDNKKWLLSKWADIAPLYK